MSTTDLLAGTLLRRRDLFPHWVREHVRWSDTDMAGHVNNLAFAAFCETGRALLLRRFIEKDAELRALLVLAEMRIRYIGEANWPAEIDVGTCVVSVGGRSCRMAQGLFDGERCIAVSESTLVMIDERVRKACTIPDAVRDVLLSWSPIGSTSEHPIP